MTSIVTDIINRQLAASSSPSAEAGKRLIALAAQLDGMPKLQHMLKKADLAETVVLAAQRGERLTVHSVDEAIRKGGIAGPQAIELKLSLAQLGLLARTT